MLNSKAETAMTLRLQIESYVLAAANMSTVAFMSERFSASIKPMFAMIATSLRSRHLRKV